MSVLMKPSGVKWIGDIPNDWKVKVLKRLLEQPLKYGANEAAELEDKRFPRYIRITDFGNDGLLRADKFKSLEPDVAEPYLLSEGDILFARSGATVGKTFQFKNYDGIACFAGYLIKAHPKDYLMTSDFLYYFTKSPAYESWKESIFTQATIQNIGADKYAYLPVCVPSIQNQNQITNFLDKSTSKIEDAIKTKQTQLKTLEALKKSIIHKAVTKGLDDSVAMKDSEIEWIGEIPKHWNIERIKDLSFEVTGGGTPKSSIDEYWEDGDIIWMTPTDFQDFQDTKYIDNSQRKITEIGLRKCSAKLLPTNTVVMTSRASIGTPKLTSVELSTNQGFISFLPSFRLSNDFLYYCIDGYLGAYFQIIASGTTFMEISPKIVKQEKIPLPPENEQQLIVAFLDKEVEKINTLKSNVQNQINKLKEYKKSLIYEYVTGKKQVKE